MPVAGPAREAAPRGNAPPVLGGIGSRDLVAGKSLRLHVRARDPDGDLPALRVRGLPDGARLVEEGGGWHRLDWTPPPGMTGDVDLTFVAFDALDPRIRSERVVRFSVRAPDLPPPPVTAPAAKERAIPERGLDPAPSEPREPDVAPPAPRPRAPLIEPLASQIVSAGRTVSFRVAATLEKAGRTPLLQIDRLPKNASFDANPDGSRTFYWPTGDREQGEHRFRITALHPDDAGLRSRADLLVIVGDPTRSITEPLDEGSTRSAGSPPAPDPRPAATNGLPPDALVPTFEDGDSPISSEDEPFLPQAGLREPDYWEDDEEDDEEDMDAYPDDPYGMGADPSLLEPDDPYFETPESDYFDGGGGMPLGPDGQPLEP